MISAYKLSVESSKVSKWPFQRSRRSCMNMYFEVVVWVYLAEDKDQQSAIVGTVMDLTVL